MPVKPIPDGYRTINPYLLVPNAAELIEFLTKAFGAVELHRSTSPDGRVMHASLRIGDSSLMMGEPPADRMPMHVMMYLYVENADATYAQAIAAGGKPKMPPTDQRYGDRAGAIIDPAGNEWWIATHIRD